MIRISDFFLFWVVIISIFPSTIFSQTNPLVNIAIQHLEKNHKEIHLTKDDISNYEISDLYTSKHNGVTHVYLQQHLENINIRNAIININILPNGKVLNMGNRFIPNLSKRINTTIPTIQPVQALEKVIEKFGSVSEFNLEEKERVNEKHLIFENEGIARRPIPVKLVFESLEDKTVRLVWQVEFFQLDGQHWWIARVDAVTGEILKYDDRIIHCNFNHSHDFCSPDNHLNFDKEDHKISQPAVEKIEAAPAPVIANSYNVYPIPLESPNHGDQELVVDPADVVASPFGWHDTNGVDGAEFTITRGNNVHAYQDIFNQNTSVGDEPDGGALLEFDFPHDESNNNPYTQVDAAVVNLFYWNNTIHDLWYQYGFDEVSGNFQANNYGNGGNDDDWVQAEALDGSGTNNANFGTPPDGGNPTMQMYIWTNNNLPSSPSLLTATAPSTVAGDYEMVKLGFGGDLPTTPIESQVVLVDDGTDETSDACEDILNGADITGKIAMIDRGNCQFGVKALKAENEGALAVIICNNDDDPIFAGGPGTDGGAVTIPVIMISLNDCNTLKLGLPDLTVQIMATDFSIPMPGPSGIDGDFDNGIIVHEYGHGISNRLTGGPSAGGCLSNFEQAGEGWSDWFGLVMQTNSNDSGEEGRGIGTYALDQNTNGEGIREFRYSRNMNINPHTYADVNSVAVPHGVGSVWAVMIWDLYWNMVDLYGFDDDLFTGEGGNNKTMQLVLDGLKLQECNPTFIDARDAIIAADVANFDGIHECLIWETFARRGLGVDAEAGGVESFDIPDACRLELKITKTANQEVLAGNVLAYTIDVRNDSPELQTNVVVMDELPLGVELIMATVSCSNFSLDNNILTINLGNIEAGGSMICTYNVLVASTPFTTVSFEDGIENGDDNWAIESPVGDSDWGFDGNSFEGNFSWYAENIDSESDQRLTTDFEYPIEGDSPALSFWHSYNTEQTWDGGVVEISTNGGNTWNDLENNFIQNGYDGNLMVNQASPISGQPAFHGNSGGYIQSVIDLTSYLGENALFRFRLGCDGAVGGNGWYIDNVTLFESFHDINNNACVTSDESDTECSDVTTVVLENTTSTNNVENNVGVSVFPNPSDGKIFIKIETQNNQPATFSLTSLDGRLLKTKSVEYSNGTFEFNISGFPKGIYSLQIQSEETIIIEKIILQ